MAFLIQGFIDGLRPEPRLTVTEWANAHRVLDSKAAAEPGPYKSSRTPYLEEIMDKLSVTDITRKIVVMKGAQIGFSEVGFNFLGYVIDVAPASFLLVMPTQDTMERNSKMRIAPMIEASPRLREKIGPNTKKNSGNTILQKEFPGGVLIMTGANSGAGLRSMPIRFLMLDEVDGYPMDVEGEGSPIGLAEQRTATFHNKKIFEISTPTVEGLSIIDADFKTTDQRYYYVPCPHCGAEQTLKFSQLKWEPRKWDEVVYQCEHCGDLIEERYKPTMLSAGRWQATMLENASIYTVGYHLNALYSPLGWKSWAEVAQQWDDAQGNDSKLKLFYNTVLGETWKEKTDAPEWERLYERRIDYPLNKPFKEVVFLTAGVDVQGDRLELEIVGWMPGRKTQQIDYRVFMGNTSNHKNDVWQELNKVVSEVWEREDGAALPLRLLVIDSGYNTAEVYKWCKQFSFSRVIPIKGKDTLENYFAPPRVLDTVKHGKKIGKQKIWLVGSSFIKAEVYNTFRQVVDPDTGEVPDGFCYFPQARDANYFRGLTAEIQQDVRNRKGYINRVWVKKYDRNEPLDTRVYNRAAASIIGMDRWSESRWKQEAEMLATAIPIKETVTQPKKPAQKSKPKSSYWNR
ncbi:phage terminase large subunit family protein [Foetidibacter luteolus]|uniref:phage terminase large subunit family protein n=1 Tax=Foetidibacter luteolus TaxID=2608880 RepID=UPI00129C0282|nr:phage terminase large subunit family protein [Foetidibacter luteolus]